MKLVLKRFAYTDNYTRGELYVGEDTFQTVEKPWFRNEYAPGGTPFESCIPDGSYRLRGFTRPSGDKAFILSNPDHGVYEDESHLPSVGRGRYLILIHPGNTVDDVVGCIAPGMTGSADAVWDSRKAMAMLLTKLEGYEHELLILPKGAS